MAGFNLSSPWVSAAGAMNGTDLSDILARFEKALNQDLGAITLGSITILPRGGNEAQFGPPVYYYDAKAKKTYNSFGLANIGQQKALELLPKFLKRAHNKNKIVIYSVSRSIEEELGSAVEQSLSLTKDFLRAGADLVEINLSTPNTVTKDGGRAPIMGLDLKTVSELLRGLAKLKNNKRVGLKMPPYLTKQEQALIPELAKLIIKSDACGFVTACNTIGNQIPVDKRGKPILSVPGGKAGMSGPATKGIGRQQLKLWRQYLDDSIDIISMLGVDSQKELDFRLKQGAAAAGGVTFFRENLSAS